MKYSSTALFPLAIMITLASLTFWLERATQADLGNVAAKRHDPDYIVEHFTVKRFGLQGELQNTLRADRMVHFPDDDSTDVTNPDMTYHTGRPTHITAEQASVDSGGKTIILNKNVKVVHANAKGPATEIRSSTLTVLPDDEIARTAAPVTITQGTSIVHGRGMEANNKTQISVLYGRVQGTIESQTK
ncbi:MAG TPA: LPS export ABC transporter periplasmic protein LptC [Rhodocyclaceae bacterium]|nr:LPS export ABC transporter periplasmic protein LptC [Rhodocyclaceae bacterium]